MTGPVAPTALVVDDDEDVRGITEIALGHVGGWEIITAPGGLRALDLAREHRPDVIVMDLMMPDMDGITTFHELQRHEESRGIPVVLLTAKGAIGDAQPWDGVGLAGVISKPFHPMTLAAEVAALVGWDAPGAP